MLAGTGARRFSSRRICRTDARVRATWQQHLPHLNIHRVYPGELARAQSPAAYRRPARTTFPQLLRRAPDRQDYGTPNRPRRNRSARSTNSPSSTITHTSTTSAWPGSGSIRDIHHRMLQKDRRLALQIDVIIRRGHDNGAIFRADRQRPPARGSHPPGGRGRSTRCCPDAASRARSRRTAERDLLSNMLQTTWRSARGMEEEPRGAPAPGQEGRAFVMVDDNVRNCDDV